MKIRKRLEAICMAGILAGSMGVCPLTAYGSEVGSNDGEIRAENISADLQSDDGTIAEYEQSDGDSLQIETVISEENMDVSSQDDTEGVGIEAPVISCEITGFDVEQVLYDTYFCSIEDKPSLAEVLAEFPETMPVYLNGGDEPTEIPVTWYCYGDDYEGTSYYFYQFRPQWDEETYQLADSLDVLEDVPYVLLYMTDDADTYSVTENENETIISNYLGSSGASVTGKAAETTIFNYLVNTLGCNTATAVGILTNIYKESGFNPTASVIDTNGKTSYGICQWNGGRYEALKTYCGSSYNTVEGQLSYLKYELENSEKSAWSKMQGFANTAAGAYEAAYAWAQYFERCAHYYNGTDQYAARGETARDTFWPVYASSASGTSKTITISGANAPSVIAEGGVFSIAGTISSPSKLTKVVVACCDAKGNMLTGKSVSPGTTTYDIYAVDDYIEFNNLASGYYIYMVVATNASGMSKTLVKQAFSVVGEAGLYKVNGGWYYCKDGAIDTSYTGMAKNDYGWWYVSNGKLDLTYTGMAQNDYGWWYMTNGKLDRTYTGMARNSYGWWYMTNGKLDRTYTGMARNKYGWWYMTNGKLDLTYTGMAQNKYGWWYITNGQLDLTYTGMALNSYGWWYMTNGQLNLKYTGIARNKYGWWYMTNGRLNRSYTGIAKNRYGNWYIKEGKVQISYSGKVTLNGKTYSIKNGKVV